MKKKMQKPEMQFIAFDTADGITTSGGMEGKKGQADGFMLDKP